MTTQAQADSQAQAATDLQPLMKRWAAQVTANSRRIGTVAMILFALFLGWTVITGRNGLTSWSQKRSENKALTQEIQELSDENARLSEHVERLKSDPGAIEFEARQRLHYARPNEIIYALPETQKPPAGVPGK
jgi:cell division protein FtsB